MCVESLAPSQWTEIWNRLVSHLKTRCKFISVGCNAFAMNTWNSGCLCVCVCVCVCVIYITVINWFIMIFFWDLVLCRLIGRCQRFGETYCLHLQGWSVNAGKSRDLYRVRPPSQHEQGGRLLPDYVTEASHSWPEKMETGSHQEHDSLQ
jgi:hypothetical protein